MVPVASVVVGITLSLHYTCDYYYLIITHIPHSTAV